MIDVKGAICDNCGAEFIHLGRGELVCPKCGNEALVGFDEDWEDDEGDGYSYDETFGSKPEVCRTCGGEYPSCKDSCNLFDD